MRRRWTWWFPAIVVVVLAEDPESCSASSKGECGLSQASLKQQFERLVDEGNALARSAGTNTDIIAQALQKYKSALELDNSTVKAAGPLTNIGMLFGKLGHRNEALQYFQKSLALDPNFFFAHHSLANMLSESHDWGGADKHFSKSVTLSPPQFNFVVRTHWANLLQRSVHYGQAAEEAFAGRDVVQEAYKIMQPVLKMLKTNKNERPDSMVVGTASAILHKLGKHKTQHELHKLAVKRGLWQDARQRPVHFDWTFAERGLSYSWWTGDKLPVPFLLEVGSHWHELRNELDDLIAKDQLKPLWGDEAELYYISKGHKWTKIVIIQHGELNPDVATIAPIATRVFGSTPLIGDALNFVSYSVIWPGTASEPHCGQNNLRNNCQLPLMVPKGDSQKVGISVADEVRGWTEGEWLCFDDSFEHKVWNMGSEPRGIINVQFRHPSF